MCRLYPTQITFATAGMRRANAGNPQLPISEVVKTKAAWVMGFRCHSSSQNWVHTTKG